METWKRRWLSLTTGRSYNGNPGFNIHPLLRNHKSRRLVSTTIQMRTGHGYNRAYLSRVPTTNIESPRCTCGYYNQTPKHLILHCKLYKTERKQLIKTIKPLPLTWRIAAFTTKGLQATLKFLESTGTGTRTWILGSTNEEDYGGWGNQKEEWREDEGERRGEERRG